MPVGAALFALTVAASTPAAPPPDLTTSYDVLPEESTSSPPPSSVTAEDPVRAYSRTVTAQFRSFAAVERKHRRVSGSLRVGAGVLMLGIGVTNVVVKRGTSAQGSGLGIFSTGAVSIASGVYSLVVRGPAESFTRTALFNHGALEGWDREMLRSVVEQTHRQARRARKRRRIIGSLLVAGGTAGGVTVSTLLGLELAKDTPNGALTSSYAQGITTSVGVVVAGVTQLVVPTIIEVLAADLGRR